MTLLDDPGLDRVLRGAQDPDAPVAVPGHRKDVHLRAIEQDSGEEVQRQDPLRLRPQELRPPRAVPAGRRVDPGVLEILTPVAAARSRCWAISTPWSQVNVRFVCGGSDANALMAAALTVSAVWLAGRLTTMP